MQSCERIMTLDPVTCRPFDTVAEVAYRMAHADVGCLPVVDGPRDRLVGILTDRDIRRRVIARGLDPRSPVESVMTRDVVTCLPADDLCLVNERMEERQLQRLPVVDRDGCLLGVVTRDDLTRRYSRTVDYDDLLEEVHAED